MGGSIVESIGEVEDVFQWGVESKKQEGRVNSYCKLWIRHCLDSKMRNNEWYSGTFHMMQLRQIAFNWKYRVVLLKIAFKEYLEYDAALNNLFMRIVYFEYFMNILIELYNIGKKVS